MERLHRIFNRKNSDPGQISKKVPDAPRGACASDACDASEQVSSSDNPITGITWNQSSSAVSGSWTV